MSNSDMKQIVKQKPEITGRILLVEDNKAYGAAALRFFQQQKPAIELVTVQDFKTAQNELKAGGLSGVITDCFFPTETGSTDIELGLTVIEKIKGGGVPNAAREQAIAAEFLRHLPQISDPELLFMIEHYAHFEVRAQDEDHTVTDPENIELIKAIAHFAATLKSKGTWNKLIPIVQKQLADYGLNGDMTHPEHSSIQLKAYEMRIALQKSPHNQALGVLVAELAQEMRIPFVIATSTYHHDRLTDLVSRYQRTKGWPELVDTREGDVQKTDSGFWGKAYNALMEASG